MYMIEISEDQLCSMAEHVEKGLKYMGKVMQCIEELKEDYSEQGAYGERGRLGMREDSDWWEEDKKRKYKERYGERYGNRMKY